MRGLKDQFATMLDQLERCQKALNSFLEEKRSAFPRLYFIGDEDLLEILGQSSNPEVIQDRIQLRTCDNVCDLYSSLLFPIHFC